MAVGILLLTAMMLSACVEVGQTSTINSDLTGTTTMRIGIAKVAVQAISAIGSGFGGTPTPNSANIADPFTDLKEQVAGMGGTVKDYDSGDFVGIEITLPFASLDEMQSQINGLLGSSSGSSPFGGSQNALAQITAKRSDSGVRIDGTVDPLSELNDPNAANALPGVDLSSLLTGGGKIELAFTLPGTITSADALANQNGNTVSWSFKVGDKTATIFAESGNG